MFKGVPKLTGVVGLARGVLANNAVCLAVALSLEWWYFYVASWEDVILALGSDGFAFLILVKANEPVFSSGDF